MKNIKKLLGILFAVLAILFNFYSINLHLTVDFLQPTTEALTATVFWFLSIVLFGISVFIFFPCSKRKIKPKESLFLVEKVIFGVILILGLALRIHKIDHSGIYLDEKYWLYEAKNILKGTIRSPFGPLADYPTNMPAYFITPFLSLLKNPYYAVRLPGVIFSMFNIIFVFSFLKEAFNKKVALVSALLLSTSIWDIHNSRLGFQNVNLNPFLISGAMFFLYRGIKYFSKRDIFICGVFLGLCINMLYVASLCVITTCFYCLYHFLFKKHKQKKQLLVIGILLLISTFITSSPTFIKIKKRPQFYLGRHQGFLRENVERSQKDQRPLFYYFKQLKSAVEDFNYQPEKFIKIGLWGASLNLIALIALVLGLIFSLKNIFLPQYLLILLNFFIMFVPIVIVYRSASLWREYAFLPTLFMLSTIGIDLVSSLLSKIINLFTRHALKINFQKVVLLLIFLVYFFFWGKLYSQYYHFHLKKHPDIYESHCQQTAHYIKDFIPSQTTLLLPDEVCQALILVVLEDQYLYQVYKTPSDLNNLKNGNKYALVYINNLSPNKIKKKSFKQYLEQAGFSYEEKRIGVENEKIYSYIYLFSK